MSELNIFNQAIRATARFGGTGFSNYTEEQFVQCNWCGKPDVRLQGNQTLEMHIERCGFTICPASGKALPQAARLRFDENYNLINEDLIEEETP